LIGSHTTRRGVVFLVDRDDTGSAKAKVVLECVAHIGYLALFSHSAELPVQLCALSEPRGSEWMPL
jgi:hypothetical protein